MLHGKLSWWSLLGASTVALVVCILVDPAWGLIVLGLAAGALVSRALAADVAHEGWPTRYGALLPASSMFALLTIVLIPAPDVWRIVAFAALFQASLAWLGRERSLDAMRWPRRVLPFTGHAAVVTGNVVLLVPGGASLDLALLAYAGGFSVLLLHARWMMAAPEGNDAWDVWLLAALAGVALSATYAYVASTGLFSWMPATKGIALGLLLVSAMGALFVIGNPPPLARRGSPGSSAVAVALAHGCASLGVLNVLFVVFSIVATWSARVLIGVITLYIAFAVSMEYRAIRRARLARRSFEQRPPDWTGDEAITVLVSARDESATLAKSLERNLRLPQRFRFLLVPAASSTDDTVAIARAAEAEHPGRVRVALGTSGSKAGDLNLAWGLLDTDLVVMLDADETIDPEALRFGLAALEACPEAAVVQGRKVSAAPEVSGLARFIATERRHATGLDQIMHAQFGSTHFAGSGAVLRRRVVEELGGWTEKTMTEDIEFTLRLHLNSQWRILYEPRMVVREADPENLAALVQQRTRWARGWMQCFSLYFGSVVDRRARLGRRRAFGLAWLLLTAVSAPIMALLPAFVFMRAVGVPSLLPWAVSVALASFILPARLVGYGYSALQDPHIPIKRTPWRFVVTLGHAYAWIFAGWLLSLHALYLELAAAPRHWYVTRKRVQPAEPLRTQAPVVSG